MWMAKSENLSHLGGPMGTEYTTTNWRKYFKAFKNAKAYCKADYKKKTGKSFKWRIANQHTACSGDLSFVMYTILKVKFED